MSDILNYLTGKNLYEILEILDKFNFDYNCDGLTGINEVQIPTKNNTFLYLKPYSFSLLSQAPNAPPNEVFRADFDIMIELTRFNYIISNPVVKHKDLVFEDEVDRVSLNLDTYIVKMQIDKDDVERYIVPIDYQQGSRIKAYRYTFELNLEKYNFLLMIRDREIFLFYYPQNYGSNLSMSFIKGTAKRISAARQNIISKNLMAPLKCYTFYRKLDSKIIYFHAKNGILTENFFYEFQFDKKYLNTKTYDLFKSYKTLNVYQNNNKYYIFEKDKFIGICKDNVKGDMYFEASYTGKVIENIEINDQFLSELL